MHNRTPTRLEELKTLQTVRLHMTRANSGERTLNTLSVSSYDKDFFLVVLPIHAEGGFKAVGEVKVTARRSQK